MGTKRKTDTKKKSKEEKKSSLPFIVFRNIVAVLAVSTATFIIIKEQPGYNWTYNSLLKGNMKTIRLYPKLTLNNRFEMKLGMSYDFLNYIKEQTPDNAVLLYPSQEDFFPPGKQSPFQHEPYNKTWATRFLYPRKLVLPNELDKNKYASEISHVVIVNGKGFERIPYPMEHKIEHGVFPINPINPINIE